MFSGNLDYETNSNTNDNHQRYLALMNFAPRNENRENQENPPAGDTVESEEDHEFELPVTHISIVDLIQEEEEPEPESPTLPPRGLKCLIKERRRVLREIAAKATNAAAARAEFAERFNIDDSSAEGIAEAIGDKLAEVSQVGQPIRRFLLKEVFEEEEKKNKGTNENLVELAQHLFYSNVFKK